MKKYSLLLVLLIIGFFNIWSLDNIVLYNGTSSAIDLTGYSVQYASSTGTSWQVTNLTGTIAVGGYYLIQEAAGAGGTTDLPTPNAVGSIAMSSSKGKVALLNSTTAISGGDPSTNANVIDYIGYGTADFYEGSTSAPLLDNAHSAIRNAMTLDTNDNADDFSLSTTDLSYLN